MANYNQADEDNDEMSDMDSMAERLIFSKSADARRQSVLPQEQMRPQDKEKIDKYLEDIKGMYAQLAMEILTTTFDDLDDIGIFIACPDHCRNRCTGSRAAKRRYR